MLYSLDYQSKKKHEADEIRVPYNHLGSISIGNNSQRYNVILPTLEVDLAIVEREIQHILKADYTIECYTVEQLKYLLSQGYNAYIRYPATDWETFNNLAAMEVSDIYIDGSLMFQMELIEIAKDDIKIRCSPTISPSLSLAAARPITSAYVRPEDICYYEDAVDIISFHVDKNKEDTLFTIYKRGTFVHDISELIPGLPQVPNTFIDASFGENRANCGQVCQIPGRHCHSCKLNLTIADKLSKLS